jgi:GNAT superfamily N-acetyltransferase
MTVRLTIDPVTPERWGDFETLFGPRGACGGCWCMWWRRKRSEFDAQKGAGNKRAMKRIINSGTPPGLIAYSGDDPIGWCAIAPREDTPGLDRSRILARVDDQPVWSITCLFITRQWRRRGVSVRLLKAAIKFAKDNGARIVEGYPHIPKQGLAPDAFVWTGIASAYEAAGFKEVERRSALRPIVRKQINPRHVRR